MIDAMRHWAEGTIKKYRSHMNIVLEIFALLEVPLVPPVFVSSDPTTDICPAIDPSIPFCWATNYKMSLPSVKG